MKTSPDTIKGEVGPHDRISLPPALYEVVGAAWKAAGDTKNESLARACRAVCEEYAAIWGVS